MDLYHAEIRLPDGFRAPKGRVPLKWTEHAARAANDDRYGVIPQHRHAILNNLEIIEVGVENGRVAKILYRGRLDADRDLCMVLIPGPVFIVKTVWVNLHSDQHVTLDRKRYVN